MKALKTVALLLICILGGVTTRNVIANETYFSEGEIEQMLAPVALYPDTLLSHIFIAATYPLEVVQADRWSQDNGRISGDQALAAIESQAFDPSVKALAAVPHVLEQMSRDLAWTQKLGEAFLHDEQRLLASVQDLRQRAHDQGSLKHLDHLDVVEDDDVIVIESKVKEVVYVPYYDTRVVYGDWHWGAYPPVYWGLSSGLSFHWGPKIFVGTGFYFSAFHWRHRNVVVVNHRHNHRFRTSRHVARYHRSQRWVHNPSHRRGVHYRNARPHKRHVRYHNGNVVRHRNGVVKAPAARSAPRRVVNNERGAVTAALREGRGVPSRNLTPRATDRHTNKKRVGSENRAENRQAYRGPIKHSSQTTERSTRGQDANRSKKRDVVIEKRTVRYEPTGKQRTDNGKRYQSNSKSDKKSTTTRQTTNTRKSTTTRTQRTSSVRSTQNSRHSSGRNEYRHR